MPLAEIPLSRTLPFSISHQRIHHRAAGDGAEPANHESVAVYGGSGTARCSSGSPAGRARSCCTSCNPPTVIAGLVTTFFRYTVWKSPTRGYTFASDTAISNPPKYDVLCDCTGCGNAAFHFCLLLLRDFVRRAFYLKGFSRIAQRAEPCRKQSCVQDFLAVLLCRMPALYHIKKSRNNLLAPHIHSSY